MIKSTRVIWAGNVARIGKKRKAYRLLVGNQKVRDYWKDHEVGGRIILKWILER
jgi:hypothetical protein